MAYADDGLAQLFARYRHEALPDGSRFPAREAAHRIGAHLDQLYEYWLAQADGPSRERREAVREGLAAVRVAVGRTLLSVRLAIPDTATRDTPHSGGAGPVRTSPTPARPDQERAEGAHSGRPRSEPADPGRPWSDGPRADRTRSARSRFAHPLNPLAWLLRSTDAPQPWPPPPPRPEVASDHLLDAVGHALESVDRSFQALASESVEAHAWDQDEDLIEVLHGLLSADERGSPELALAKISSLRDKLRLQRGIEVLGYDPADPAHDILLFEFTAPAVPGGPGRCHAPALVSGTRVLRRGAVRPLLPAVRTLPPEEC